MKIAITHNETDVLTAKDYTNSNPGLIGQFIVELEIIKKDLIEMYEEDEE